MYVAAAAAAVVVRRIQFVSFSDFKKIVKISNEIKENNNDVV